MSDATGGGTSGTGGGFYKFLASLHGVLPDSLYIWIAKTMMQPQQLAHVLSHLPSEPLPDIVAAIPMALNARVAVLLEGNEVQRLVDVLPMELLVDVARALVDAGEYETMAKFGEAMTPSRVKALVVMMNNPESMAHAAQYFNSVTLGRIADGFSGSYITRLADALDRLGYHEVEAELGQFMADDHLLGLIKGLQPAHAARFLLCLDEKRCDDLLGRVKDSHREAILNHLAQGGEEGWVGSFGDEILQKNKAE